MPNPNERSGSPFAAMADRMIKELTTPQAARPPAKKIEDMTPAEIYAKHGEDVASYIIRLRSSVEMWKRIRLGDADVPQLIPLLKDAL